MCLHKGFYYTEIDSVNSTQHFMLAGLLFFISIVLCVACFYHTYCSKTAARARMDLIVRNFSSAKATAQRKLLGAFQMRDVYSPPVVEVDVERGEPTDRL